MTAFLGGEEESSVHEVMCWWHNFRSNHGSRISPHKTTRHKKERISRRTSVIDEINFEEKVKGELLGCHTKNRPWF